MDWTLEVVVLPVSDIDRSVAFYRDQVGFDLDHDTKTEHMHVVQLTPRGSGCSIVFGDLPSQREMGPGSIRGLQLCVADGRAARAALVSRGTPVPTLAGFALPGPVPRRVAALLAPAPAPRSWPSMFTAVGMAAWTAAAGTAVSAMSSANSAVTMIVTPRAEQRRA